MSAYDQDLARSQWDAASQAANQANQGPALPNPDDPMDPASQNDAMNQGNAQFASNSSTAQSTLPRERMPNMPALGGGGFGAREANKLSQNPSSSQMTPADMGVAGPGVSPQSPQGSGNALPQPVPGGAPTADQLPSNRAAAARDAYMKNAPRQAAFDEQAAQAAIPKPTMRDKASFVLDAFMRAGMASSNGMAPGAAMAFGVTGAQEAMDAKNKGLHDAVIAQSAKYRADAEKAGKDASDSATADMNYAHMFNVDNETKSKTALQDSQAKDVDAQAAQRTADAKPGSLKSRETESVINKNNAERNKANKAENHTETLVDDKGGATIVDRDTATSRKVKDSTTGEALTGVTKPGAKKDADAAKAASDDKLLTQARQTFKELNEAAAKRNSKSLHPADANKDPSNDTLAYMKKNMPDQYEAYTRNSKGAAPATKTPSPGASKEQQKVIDAQVKQDTKTKKPDWMK